MSKTKLLDKPFVHKVLGTDPTKPDEMQPKEVLSYSFAGFGQNLICALVTSFFLFFLTDAVRMDAVWLAFMFLGARLFDAFNDPIMGTIVDRTRTKDGKMRPYLKATPIPIAIMTILLFIPYNNIIPNKAGAFALATVVYIIWGICYTIVDVPYWGLASSMTKDTDKRNTMLTVARLFCTIGAGIVTVLLPAIQGIVETSAINNMFADAGMNITGVGKDAIIKASGDLAGITSIVFNEANGTYTLPVEMYNSLAGTFETNYKILYFVAAVIIAVASIPTFYIGYKNTKERFYDEESSKASLGHNVKLLGKNRPIIMLILVGVLGCLRLIYMTSGIYYAKYNCDNVGLFSIMTLLVVPGGLIATVLTPVLSRKFGKRNVFLYSHLVGGIAMLIVYFIGIPSAGASTLSQILFFVVLVLLGVPSGFSNILQYSMIADSIDYLEDKTGERAEGICFSMQTFISKIGMAFTAFTTLLVLGTAGYANADALKVDPAMKSNIWMMTTLFAAVSTIACCIPLFFYTFTEKKQAEAVARIEKRKALKKDSLALLENAKANIDKSANLNASDIDTAIDKINAVFKCRDINPIMDELKAKDGVFFDILNTESVTAENANCDSSVALDPEVGNADVENASAVNASDDNADVENVSVENTDADSEDVHKADNDNND